MAKRARKKAVAVSRKKPKIDDDEGPSENGGVQFEERQRAFNSHEGERRIAAFQAIRTAEIENLVSRLRLLRSYFRDDQLDTPALNFFKENLANVSVTRKEEYKIFELNWNNDKDSFVTGRNVATLFDNAAASQCIGGLQISLDSVKKSILEAVNVNLQIPDLGCQLNASVEPWRSQSVGTGDTFSTLGGTNGNRSSFVTTPKTVRLPKNGEILLSIRGSPLGVFKEDNLEAIHESDGPRDVGS